MKTLALLILALFPFVAVAAPGSTAANFLKMGVGARGSAMGEAQTAVSEDVTASYWNPAGLVNLRSQEVALMHYQLVESIRYQYASYGLPTNRYGTFGFGLSRLDYGSINGYTDGGLPSGQVEASHMLVTGSWAKQVFPNNKISVGVNLKQLRSELAGFKGNVAMMDAGLLGHIKDIRLAATLRNMGSDVTYDREGSALPQQTVLGAGLSALGGNLTLALDWVKPKDNKAFVASGVEYRVFEMLNLRVGYNGKSDFVGNGLTYGLGLQFAQWNIDYALVPFGDLGNTNRVSVALRFGRTVQMKSAEDQVNFAYRKAQRQLALGRGVEAYSTLNELLLIAPWHKPSAELKAKIEKQFGEMAVDKNKAKMDADISDKFTAAKAAFDRDDLVAAKKGFETILGLNADHVGSKVYLEKIENRYQNLAQAAFKQGMDYFAAGDYLKAKLSFQKTVTINESHVDAKAMLAKTEEVMADASKREEEMKRLAGAQEAYKDGLQAYQRNDFERALAKFDEVKKLAPDFEESARYYDLTKVSLANILFEESQVNFQNGQLKESVERLTRASELMPDDARIASALQVSKRDLETKNAEESQKLYKSGLEAYLSGNSATAEKEWRRAVELDASNQDALNALNKMKEMKKNEQ